MGSIIERLEAIKKRFIDDADYETAATVRDAAQEIRALSNQLAAYTETLRDAIARRDELQKQVTDKLEVPERCPITGYRFFCVMNYEGRKLPTYGGPLDSFTVPVAHPSEDFTEARELIRTTFNHDDDCRAEDESTGLFVVKEATLIELYDLRDRMAEIADQVPADIKEG